MSAKEETLVSLAHALVTLCREKKLRFTTAESCTGGLIASCVTAVSGASCVFEGAFVTYTPELKMRLLSVREETVRKEGVVSHTCAREMALGAQKASGADLSVSVTGYAGPTGGTEEDPVGTVYFGISTRGELQSVRRVFSGTRNEVREKAAAFALKLLLKAAHTGN